MKILFYYNSAVEVQQRNLRNRIYIQTAHLYLKTYIDINNPSLSAQLEWLQPQQAELSDKELIDLINKTQPDVFCTSHYIWNNYGLMLQLERIKPYIDPNIIMVSGGPSISVNLEPDFFERYPFVNYAIYGPGERAFHDLLEALVNKKTLYAFNTSNLAWFDQTKNKQIVAGYQYVPMTQVSPYLHNKENFSQMIRYEQSLGYSPAIPYELTRGCPYACTFCDWNSGFGNKTTRRKNTYQEEIDLFHELELYDLYLSDANVGQYDEDIDMIAYFADKNINHGARFILKGNYSKLKKANNLKIFHLLAQGNLTEQGFIIAVQDINPQVLKNIDRPDITWAEHGKIIDELFKSHPHLHSTVQLIQGLPGQTVDSWRQTLKEICRRPVTLQIFLNEVLPASPAMRDPEYQEKWQYIYSTSERYTDRHSSGNYFRGKFPESSATFTQYNFVQMSMLSHIYSALAGIKFVFSDYHSDFDTELYVSKFLQSRNYKMLLDNLYNNWLSDKFYYTISFNGKPKTMSACSVHEIPLWWSEDEEFRNFILEYATNDEFKTAYRASFGTRKIIDAMMEY